MHARSSAFPRNECRRCNVDAWVECGACGRWYCGPCSRDRTGTTACAHCQPSPEREAVRA